MELHTHLSIYDGIASSGFHMLLGLMIRNQVLESDGRSSLA